ncbi:hypothetical protein [Nocardia sp.]|uniref:hypothetical protein n=1 Tax=Nocardia sp. TaxID=1821 RepID=UPI00260EBB6C|nr:hypothetical protein [Nocardia sp.]
MPAATDDPSGTLGHPHHDRNTPSHAGESSGDLPNSPGLTLAAIGIVSVALTLTIGGYGFAGLALVGAAVSVLCLGFGITLVVAEHDRDRVRKQHRGRLTGE